MGDSEELIRVWIDYCNFFYLLWQEILTIISVFLSAPRAITVFLGCGNSLGIYCDSCSDIDRNERPVIIHEEKLFYMKICKDSQISNTLKLFLWLMNRRFFFSCDTIPILSFMFNDGNSTPSNPYHLPNQLVSVIKFPLCLKMWLKLENWSFVNILIKADGTFDGIQYLQKSPAWAERSTFTVWKVVK